MQGVYCKLWKPILKNPSLPENINFPVKTFPQLDVAFGFLSLDLMNLLVNDPSFSGTSFSSLKQYIYLPQEQRATVVCDSDPR